MEGAADLVACLRAAGGDPEEVAQTVRGLIKHPEVIEAALGYEDRCGVTVLESSSELTVQRIVWPAGIRIAPHDHCMWSVVGVYRGCEDNYLYLEKEGDLVAMGCQSLDEGGVLVLGDDEIHAIANPGSTPCVALHVYGGDILSQARTGWDLAGRNPRPFDLAGAVRMVEALRAREDELGRPLNQAETMEMSVLAW